MRIFFDASVLFSAIYSSVGASRVLAQLVLEGKVIGVITETVVEELVRNMEKIRGVDTQDVYEFVAGYGFVIRSRIVCAEIEPFVGLVEEKDAHVVAGAILTECDYLVTLDKKHLDNSLTKKRVLDVVIVSPGKMLEVITDL